MYVKPTRTSIALVLASALLIALSFEVKNVDGANILGVFTSGSPSHLIVHMSVAKALAERGHNVTVVTTLKPKVTHDSINVIIIPPTQEQQKIFDTFSERVAGQKNTILSTVASMFGSLSVMIDMQFTAIQDKRFTALYDNPDTKFDLIILGYFMNDFQLGVAAKFKCPIIVEWTGIPNILVDQYIGNPSAVSYAANNLVVLGSGERMNFIHRLKNLSASIFFTFVSQALTYRMHNFYNELFANEADFPSYNEIKKNVSMLFCNNHFSEGLIRANVPAYADIGGIQIKEKPDPLPADVGAFLKAAHEHGAILFSLGTNVKSVSLKPDITKTIFDVLSSLKQNVIWKWEDLENTPGNATNILFKKWLPQDDILAHANMKLFITHAGKGGVVEAQYHGVPMIALPVFGDQLSNAERMAVAGYGLKLELLEITADPFKAAITEVLDNPVYTANVKKFSKLYRDRPLTAKETAVYWAEYVIRHHGAAHMQSPLVHMNTIESSNLDIFAFLSILFYAVWRIFKFAYGKLKKLWRSRRTAAVSKQQKENKKDKVKEH